MILQFIFYPMDDDTMNIRDAHKLQKINNELLSDYTFNPYNHLSERYQIQYHDTYVASLYRNHATQFDNTGALLSISNPSYQVYIHTIGELKEELKNTHNIVHFLHERGMQSYTKRNLHQYILKLEHKITEMEYRPGGEGAIQAQNDFYEFHNSGDNSEKIINL